MNPSDYPISDEAPPREEPMSDKTVEIINELLLEIQNLRGWAVWPAPTALPPAVKRAFDLLHAR